MVLKRCSSERGEREKRFYRGVTRTVNQPLNNWNVSNVNHMSWKKPTTTKRRKSKKIRGGVTVGGWVKAQDLKRLPEDVFGEIREMHPREFPQKHVCIRRACVRRRSKSVLQRRPIFFNDGIFF